MKYACILFGLIISGHVYATDLTLTGLTGLDSNPLSLSDQHDPQADIFLYGDVKFSGNYFDNFYVKAYARQKIFIDDDQADWFKSKLDLAYKSKFKVGTNSFRYELSTDITNRDKTYVSKTTGEEATFNGQSIKDRYDYVNTNFNAAVSYRNESRIKYKLRYQIRDKNYENFSIPGLSNFDYEHDRLALSIDYPVSEASIFVFEIGITKRDFKDKRADDLNGDDIPNTDLEYDYNNFGIDYYYKSSKKLRFKLAFDYVERSDNAVGYADSTLTRFTISGKYALSDKKTLGISLAYSEYSYDNRSIVDEFSLEEDDNDRDSLYFDLKYEELLSASDDNELSLYVLLEIDDIKSTDPIYERQRNSISVGVRYDLL